jgi:hypothetical protein
MSLIGEAIGFSILGILMIVNRPQADLNGFSGGQLHCNGRWRWCSFSGCGFPYCRLHPTGGSVPDVLSRWPSGANPPVSISLGPSRPWLSLRRPERTCGAQQGTSFSFLAT